MEISKVDADDHDEVTQTGIVSTATHVNQSIFVPVQMHESLLEKLKLLDYEQQYCHHYRIKGLSKLYFINSANPGEQFNTFVGLAAWLIRLTGCPIEAPQEYDDPNATVATILESLRLIMGQALEFPPSKLKSGSGEYCIHVLDLLADAAIRHSGICYELPQLNEEEVISILEDKTVSASEDGDLTEWPGSKVCLIESETESRLVAICDSEVDEESADDEIPAIDSGTTKSQAVSNPVQNDQCLTDENSFIDPHGPFGGLLTGRRTLLLHNRCVNETSFVFDESNWEMEVERVLPQLRISTRNETKDWRSHLEQIGHHISAIDATFTDSRGCLKRIHEELSRGLDKISNREKYVNSQIDRILTEYRCAQDRLSEVKEAHLQAIEGMANRSKTLAQLSEEVERVKQEMEQRGSSMTDGSPVVRIKQAIQRLKAENVAMEIRTGVLEHLLLRLHLRAREESQKPLFAIHHPFNSLNLAHIPSEEA